MMDRGYQVQISTAPFLHDTTDTPKLMWEVVYSLIPVVLVSFYFFGMSALLVIVASVGGCLLTEWFFNRNDQPGLSLWDGSALITGLLLALTLPPGFPLWMAFLGGVVAIGVGKLIWGGLGHNIFNPALLGRAFLQAAFPTAITTWELPDGKYLGVRGTNLAVPGYQADSLDGLTGATPLASMKFEQESTEILNLLLGNTSGSLGETSGLLLVVIGCYLIYRRIIQWRIPVGILGTVFIVTAVFYLIDSQYPSPLFMWFAGGLMFGTVYMATDLVTSPLTPRGIWIYSIGIGILVVLIRLFGGLPEGVMYAILFMNAATPLLNRFSKTRVYGHR